MSVLVTAPADEPNDFSKGLNLVLSKFEGRPNTPQTRLEVVSEVTAYMENNLNKNKNSGYKK